MPVFQNTFLKILFFCVIVSLVFSNQASAIVKLNFAGAVAKNGDTIPHLNLFYSLRWDVTVIYKNDKKDLFFNCKADSLLRKMENLKSVMLVSNFILDKSMLGKVYVIRYRLTGSTEIKINSQPVLHTGIFAKSNNEELFHTRLNSFIPFIVNDTMVNMIVTYLPPEIIPEWNLNLDLGENSWSEKARKKTAQDRNEAYGIGAFYLSFALIFFFLFLFFRTNRENLYFSLFCGSAALSFFIELNQNSLYTNFLSNIFLMLLVEFLSIFFAKVLIAKEKTKIPLLIIVVLSTIFVHPLLLFNTNVGLRINLPDIFVICALIYSGFSVLYYLIQGLYQKKWEAKYIAIGSSVGLFFHIIIPITFALIFANQQEKYEQVFSLSSIFGFCIYPVVVAFVLGKRNGIIQKQLIEQVNDIEKLSQENLEKEQEKKKILEQQNIQLEIKVAGRTKELESKNEVITIKNKEITDSLTYAKRIQAAILPDNKLIYKSLSQSFILYIPKDIVSGDFYAFAQKNNKVIIAAADCTGHGVAGALMSMIGSSLLNQIINEREITSPGKILDELNTGIIHSLKQKDSESNDGMDIALCSFDLVNNNVVFSGANRPLWLVRKNELIPYKPNKLPIGGLQVKHDEKFIEHKIALQKNDTVYLFSDGYADQFGGELGKKMMLKRFRETLLSIQDKNMQEQELHLAQYFSNWKKNNEQVDDVLVIGIRV